MRKTNSSKLPKIILILGILFIGVWLMLMAAFAKAAFLCLFGDLCG